MRERVPRRCSTRSGSTSTGSTFIKAETDRVWIRDSGPTFLVNDRDPASEDRVDPGRLEVQRLGEVRQPHGTMIVSHARSPPAWSETLGAPRRRSTDKPTRVVMEGGAIDVNGQGTLLATEECLLSDVQARNPGLDREATREGLRRLPRRLATSSGSARGSSATTPTATWMTSPGSSARERSSPSVESTRNRTRTTSLCRKTCDASAPRATRTASRFDRRDFPCPRRWFSRVRDCPPVTRISTSPMAWFSCPPSTTRTTARL